MKWFWILVTIRLWSGDGVMVGEWKHVQREVSPMVKSKDKGDGVRHVGDGSIRFMDKDGHIVFISGTWTIEEEAEKGE